MKDYRFDRDSSFESCHKEKRNSNGVFVIVVMNLGRRGDFLSPQNMKFTFQRIFVEALNYLDIPVSTNQPIGNGFSTFKDKNFEHKSCIPTNSPYEDPQIMIEDLEHICGRGTVHLKYSYKNPM